MPELHGRAFGPGHRRRDERRSRLQPRAPEEADDLAEAEKAALHYADLMATDHLAVDEAVFDRLRRHFDDEQIVELGAHIGMCVGFGRLSATWDLVDDLPTSFRSDDAAPWSEGATIR